MTSSLVGSEMCIRDRCCSRDLGRWRPGPATSCCRLANPVAPNRSGPSPVSYTHLTLPTICSV
eukprot:4185751-Prorocentrum_lima.AAC.1